MAKWLGHYGGRMGRFVQRVCPDTPRHFQPAALFVAPAIGVMLLLSIVPTLFLFAIAFTNYELGTPLSELEFVGIKNFVWLFSGSNPDFYHSVFVSLFFMFAVSATEITLGLAIALLLHSIEFWGKAVVLGILVIPQAMTPSIAAQMWKLMLNAEYGIINRFLKYFFDSPVIWLGDGKMALLSIMIVDIWQYTPFVLLILYAGLRSLPNDPYEAAMIAGANKGQIFCHITLPMLKKLVYLAFLFRMVDALKLFDTVFVLTQGGPGRATELLSMHIFRLANAQNGLIGKASAVALVLLCLVTLLGQGFARMMRK